MDPGGPSFRVDATTVAALEVPLWGYPIDYDPLRGALGLNASGRGCRTSARCDIRGLSSAPSVSSVLLDPPDEVSVDRRRRLHPDRRPRSCRTSEAVCPARRPAGPVAGHELQDQRLHGGGGLGPPGKLDAVVQQRRAARAALLATLHPQASLRSRTSASPMVTAASSTAVRLGSITSSLFRAGIETDVHRYGYRVANTHPLFASEAESSRWHGH